MTKLEKLLAQAEPHLEPSETVDAAVQGTYETSIMGSDSVRSGVLIATPSRVVFYAKKMTGYDLESFPYTNISSFEQGKNMMGHNISFFASGNKVHVKWINDIEGMQALTAAVKERMTQSRQAPPSSSDQGGSANIADVIRQLDELRSAGLLTQDEFDRKKSELLDRL